MTSKPDNSHEHDAAREPRTDIADDPRLTAYALGELEGAENAADRAEIEALLARDPAAREAVAQIRAFADDLTRDFAAEAAQSASDAGLTLDQRRKIESAFQRAATPAAATNAVIPAAATTSAATTATAMTSGAATSGTPSVPSRAGGGLRWLRFAPALAAGLLVAVLVWRERDEVARGPASSPSVAEVKSQLVTDKDGSPRVITQLTAADESVVQKPEADLLESEEAGRDGAAKSELAEAAEVGHASAGHAAPAKAPAPAASAAGEGLQQQATAGKSREVSSGNRAPPSDSGELELLQSLGYTGSKSKSGHGGAYRPPSESAAAPAARVSAAPPSAPLMALGYLDGGAAAPEAAKPLAFGIVDDRDHDNPYRYFRSPPGGEGYERIVEGGFLSPLAQPLSTFSVDVDTASYANMRRFLNAGQVPPADAVRIEELINYFHYDYPQPEGADPFSVTTDVTSCPWAPSHRLVRIGLQGRIVPQAERAPSNLVFLVDVSGSMNSPDKLPLVQASLRLLVGKLDARDRIAVVVYAGNAGLVLSSTSCAEKQPILDALDRLSAGGSTAGGAGIALAYQVAAANFIKGGTNRVILATDGDFNVGVTSRDELQALIERSAKTGVFLTVLGYGTGNLKDGTAELLADKGNGNYAYIDSLAEAQKVLVQQMGGTLITIAKDVKIQVEFNPGRVGAYRLIGYENRALAARDFNDDRKDAGEIGSGHSVTALYEVIPVGVELPHVPSVDPLKYQSAPASGAAGAGDGVGGLPAQAAPQLVDSPELLNVKLRYKQPDGDTSKLLERPLTDSGADLAEASADSRFAAAVAAFGMLLRHSGNAGDASFDSVIALAEAGRGADTDGYRAEFVRLVRIAQSLMGQAEPLHPTGDNRPPSERR